MNKLLSIISFVILFTNVSISQICNPETIPSANLTHEKSSKNSHALQQNNSGKLVTQFIKSDNSRHILGIDFGTNLNQSPLNWRSITSEGTFSSFITESGGESNVELEITTAPGSYAYHYDASVNANTIPNHQNLLDDIAGNLYHFGGDTEIYLKFKGLEPFSDYCVWIFSVRDGSAGMNQNVSITGHNETISFTQIAADKELFINDQLGSSTKDLDDYILSIPANSDGEIWFTVTSLSELYVVAGLAIDIKTPTIQTDSVQSLSSTAAILNGNLINLGDPEPTQHGFCWNTTGNPNLNDNITQNGPVNSTGIFNSSVTNLVENTTYYIRAYATNKTGTEYGDEIIYTHTPPSIPLNNITVVITLILISGFILFRISYKP